jgi:hypothetical protein
LISFTVIQRLVLESVSEGIGFPVAQISIVSAHMAGQIVSVVTVMATDQPAAVAAALARRDAGG